MVHHSQRLLRFWNTCRHFFPQELLLGCCSSIMFPTIGICQHNSRKKKCIQKDLCKDLFHGVHTLRVFPPLCVSKERCSFCFLLLN